MHLYVYRQRRGHAHSEACVLGQLLCCRRRHIAEYHTECRYRGPGTRLSRYGQYILRACQPPDALRCRCHCRDTVNGAPRVLPHACGRFAFGAFRGCRQSRQGAYGCIVASRLLWRRQHYDGGSRQALPGGLQHAGVAPDGPVLYGAVKAASSVASVYFRRDFPGHQTVGIPSRLFCRAFRFPLRGA